MQPIARAKRFNCVILLGVRLFGLAWGPKSKGDPKAALAAESVSILADYFLTRQYLRLRSTAARESARVRRLARCRARSGLRGIIIAQPSQSRRCS
jgi:hypothetical protein